MANKKQPSGRPGARLSASQEDYLEAILAAGAAPRGARVTDLAAGLGVTKASVTGALRNLLARGLVDYAPYGAVRLTTAGAAAARKVAWRHQVLHDFFAGALGADEAAAQSAACAVEHAIPPRLLRRVADFLAFLRQCPRTAGACLPCFTAHGGAIPPAADCVACVRRGPGAPP